MPEEVRVWTRSCSKKKLEERGWHCTHSAVTEPGVTGIELSACILAKVSKESNPKGGRLCSSG